ncbi:MAG TPA: sensor histidine kinase [Thermoanaerobaculia bacterium]|nr:sensor histidine kinase [Thermoanaerobaculia bacterium]
MQQDLIPQSRAERLIALGRAVIATAAFVAVYLDPLEPALHPRATYALLIGYVVYSLVSIVVPAGSSRRFLIGTHVFDLAFFGAVNYLTAGASSPFFVFFVFSIVCAMLRFGRRGTLNAATAAFVIFMLSVVARMDVADFELNRFIIRCVYLLVIASLLVYVADYQQRIQSDLARIVRWRRTPSNSYEQFIGEMMREPALIFGAKRVLLVYEHVASRSGFLGRVADDDLVCERVPRELVETLFDSAPATYVRSGSFAAITEEREQTPAAPPRAPSALPPELVAAYDINDVVATPFTGDFVAGRLLLLDGRQPLLEEVNLARIVATVIASRLDHYHAGEQLRRGAVAEERVRVARDLHDSVLQALTGVALQLRTLPRLMQRDAELAQHRLDEIEQTIVTAQKDLRWFIEQLHADHRREDDEAATIAGRLLSMSQRFEKQWGLTVDADVAPIIPLLPVPMRHEVYTIVSEAVANAAKHASATCVRVKARVDRDAVFIDVADDGKGFPFRGRYTVPELRRQNLGPVTLRDRVTSLGGSMVLDSSERGSAIEIRLPLHGEAT